MIDIGEMVRMAKERADQRWVVVSISEMSNPDDGRFCKDAPSAILHFAEHVSSLQEYVRELQQRIAELETIKPNEITVVEARLEAQRKRMRVKSDIDDAVWKSLED